MAIKYNLDDDDVVEYGEYDPLVPSEIGKLQGILRSIQDIESENLGKEWIVITVEVVESDMKSVTEGRVYRHMLAKPSNAKNKNVRSRKIRSVVAALLGEDVNDKAFKAMRALDDLLKRNDKGEFESEDNVIGLCIDCYKLNPVTDDEGKDVVYAEYRYSPLELSDD